ncbi:MAG: DUF371 domain-containing protein [Candidatus Bathyarchaeota archaeon]|nr:DUF371 domain-containing protein [Candidatus Bathyarchaeota archaeon]MDH5733283.1 DUF371 domain-containing protein [Candidatus Bathyarchaeota archaeon]
MKITEIIWACGHKNILSIHKTTFETTREADLTKHGDCIIAVKATKGAKDIHPKFKKTAMMENAQLTIAIEANGMKETVRARGSSRLTFTNSTDIVIRKSGYVCGRTVAIRADKAASDLSRKLVEKLRDPHQKIKITLAVEDY